VPTPTPGPGEVIIQVHAVSVNRTLDIQVRQDGGNYGVTLPLVLGNDPSGVVVEVGQGVLDVRCLYQQRLQVKSGLGAERQEDLERALQLGRSGEFKVLIDRIMPLQEAAAAHRLVDKNEPLGKVVLDPTMA
jgi:NADPH:quinone reductase-like Zn-dependent oxidoreductase